LEEVKDLSQDRLRNEQRSPVFITETECVHYAVRTYVLTPWSKVLLEKLAGFQLVKKLPAFYGTRRFIAAFTSALLLSQLDPIHNPTSYFLKIHLNIILPSNAVRTEYLNTIQGHRGFYRVKNVDRNPFAVRF
jgi:hypothetical protein